MPENTTFNVALIDDDLTMREMLKDYFSMHFSFSKVRGFDSGEEVLNADLNSYDLILLDYHLSSAASNKLNGLQVLKQLNQVYPGKPVIVLSGQENPEVAANTVKYGAHDYIIKNEDTFNRLGKVVNELLQRNTLKNELSNRRKWVNVALFIATTIFIVLLAMKMA